MAPKMNVDQMIVGQMIVGLMIDGQMPQTCLNVCIFVHLCIRTVDTLKPNRLHILNQHYRRGSTGYSFPEK